MRATAFRVAQVVRARTITTRRTIEEICRTHTAGVERTNDLRDAQIVEVQGKLGRFHRLGLHSELGYAIGVDVSHGQISVTIASADLEPRRRRPLVKHKRDVEYDAEGTLALVAEAISEVVDEAEQEGQIRPDKPGPAAGVKVRSAREKVIGVGLGLPGLVDREQGRVSRAAYILPGWAGVRPGKELERHLRAVLPGVPVVVENDTSLGALGVLTCEVLAARGEDGLESVPADLLYVAIGGGIGGGIVANGQLSSGGAGFAGEIGHLKVADHGPLCPRCGQRGCLETKAAEPSVAGQIERAGIIALPKNEDPIELMVGSDHPACARALADAGWHVGIAIAHAATLLDPSRVYLSGTLAKSPAFRRGLEHALEETALRARDVEGLIHPEPPELQRFSGAPGLLGALALVIHRLGDVYIADRIRASCIKPWTGPSADSPA